MPPDHSRAADRVRAVTCTLAPLGRQCGDRHRLTARGVGCIGLYDRGVDCTSVEMATAPGLSTEPCANGLTVKWAAGLEVWGVNDALQECDQPAK